MEKALKTYSTKYYTTLKMVLDYIREGKPGKIMIYHHRVKTTGVLMLQAIFTMNGFLDENASASNNTICAICGITRVDHQTSLTLPGHDYTPARFVMAHSDIDRAVMIRSKAKYNEVSNDNGYQIRLLIGSRIIREGHNFRSVVMQILTSMPVNYPTLIQVIGRVVRKNSHQTLSVDERKVTIHILVSTHQDALKVSPELQRYILKGQEYLVIQEVERYCISAL